MFTALHTRLTILIVLIPSLVYNLFIFQIISLELIHNNYFNIGQLTYCTSIEQNNSFPHFISIQSKWDTEYILSDNMGNIYSWSSMTKAHKDELTGALTHYTPEKISFDTDDQLSTSQDEQDFVLDAQCTLWWIGNNEIKLDAPIKIMENVVGYTVSPRTPHKYYGVGILKKDHSFWISLLDYNRDIYSKSIQPAQAIEIMKNVTKFSLKGANVCIIDGQNNAWIVENLYDMYNEPVKTKIVLQNVKEVCCTFESIAFIKQDGTLWQMGRIIGQPEEHTLFIAPMEWAQEPVPVSMNEQENILAGRERMRRFLTEDSEGTKSYYHADALSKEKRNYYLTYFQDCFSDEELRKAKQDMKNELLQEYFSKFFDFFTTDPKI